MGRGKGRKNRNAHQKAHDQKQESALRKEGKSFRAIAEDLGISYETVRKDLAIVDQQLQSDAKEDMDALKRQVAAKLRFAQAESAVAWRFSQQPAVKQVTKVSAGGTETTTTIEGRSGDGRHMSNYLAAVDKEGRLFNLFKPAVDENIDLTEFEKALAEQLQAAERDYGAP